MESDAADAAHAMYARLGFVVVRGKMSATKSAAGVWKKTFAFPAGRADEQHARARSQRPRRKRARVRARIRIEVQQDRGGPRPSHLQVHPGPQREALRVGTVPLSSHDGVAPPGDQHTAGSFANKAVASQTPEGKVRSWVEANFTHVSEARHGTKLKLIYEAYRTHSAANTMGRNELAACLKTLYPAIKHRCAKEGDIYLVRVE